MAYSRYATEMKDGDNNIYGLMDEEAREQLSDLNSALVNEASNNIFKSNALTTKKYVTEEGEETHNLLGHTDYYKIPNWCKQISYLNQLTSGGVVYVLDPPMVFYDENKENPVQVASPGNAYRGQVTNYNVPNGKVYVRFNYSLADADVMYISFVQGQFEQDSIRLDGLDNKTDDIEEDVNNQRLIIPVDSYGSGFNIQIINEDVIQKTAPSSMWAFYVFRKINKIKCNYTTNQYILMAYRYYENTNTFNALALCVASGQYYGKLVLFFINRYTFDSSAVSGIPSFDISKLTVTNNNDGTFFLDDGTNTFTVDISSRTDVTQNNMKFCLGGIGSSYYSSDTVMQKIYNDYSDGVKKIDLMIDDKIVLKSTYKSMMGACIGDSITAQATYINTLKNELQLASLYNYGVSGSSIAKDSASDSDAFCVRVDSMNLTGVTMITVLGGTNDYQKNISIGQSSDTSLTTFYGAVKYVINKLVSTRPKATIIFMTPTKRNLSGDPANGINQAGHTLKDYRDVIIEVCSDYSIPVLDLWADSGMNTINLSNYTVDGLHWNSTMGVKMGKTIARFVENHPKSA